MTADSRRSSEDELRNGDASVNAVEPWLVSLLTCPVDHAAIVVEGSDLVCLECGRRFPVRDGIPVMIVNWLTSEHKF